MASSSTRGAAAAKTADPDAGWVSPPVRPPAGEGSPLGLDPLQHCAGVAKYFQELQRASLAYDAVRDTLDGRSKMPILTAGLNGQTLEVDVDAFVKHLEGAPRAAALRQMLRPWHDYYAAQFQEALQNLHYHAIQAWAGMGGKDWLGAPELAASFEELLGVLAGVVENIYSPAWDEFQRTRRTAELEEDAEERSLTLRVGSGENAVLTLHELLGLVPDSVIRRGDSSWERQVVRRVWEVVVDRSREHLLSCLGNVRGCTEPLCRLLQENQNG